MPQSASINPDLIVFGGTFDPPHSGHAEVVDLIHEKFPSAKIHVVPAFRPVVSASVEKVGTSPFQHRFAMAELQWREDIEAGWLVVSDLESCLPTPSYTIQTLKALMGTTVSLGLVIGLDQLQVLHQWRDPLGILQACHLIVVSRVSEGAQPMSPDSIALEIEVFCQKIGVTGHWDGKESLYRLDGFKHVIHSSGAVTSTAASTRIREILAQGKMPPEQWLRPVVAQYAAAQKLYGKVT